MISTGASTSVSHNEDADRCGSSELDSAALPRVTIRFCTQCKWMLRAAYYAQELLSTFSTSLGEVSLQPSTGGTFVVTIQHQPAGDTASSKPPAVQQRTLWDRKTDGGFPETKELKRRVRDVIEPERNLGHVDRDHARPTGSRQAEDTARSGMPESQPEGRGQEGDEKEARRKGMSLPMIPAEEAVSGLDSRVWRGAPPHSGEAVEGEGRDEKQLSEESKDTNVGGTSRDGTMQGDSKEDCEDCK